MKEIGRQRLTDKREQLSIQDYPAPSRYCALNAALGAMGLSISDAIRLLMQRIADERRLPFEVKVPNAATREAMAELAAGKGTKFASVDALMADLHADD